MNREKPAAAPIVREEDGEVSLYFGFPTIQSRMLKADPARLILDYTRTMMGFLLLHASPQRIAMIGLGGGSLAKYCHQRLPQSDFTAVELCPEVIALRSEFGVPDDDQRFRVVCADGADFVARHDKAFDVLLVDGFDAAGQPAQLASAAFYAACFAALRERGVLVVNLCADDPAYALCLRRIEDAFAGRVRVVTAEDGENHIAFASKSQDFPPPFSAITGRLAALELAHPVELAATAQKILAPKHSRRGPRRPAQNRR